VIAQYILLYTAIAQLNTGVALTLGNITPIFVFILAIIFLREKPTLKKALIAILILILSFII
jgi:drug/metabolite transporter (DMT)-like permease